MLTPSCSGKFLRAAIFWWLACSSVSGAVSEESPTFESAVAPIFKAKCLVCHSGSNPQAGLDLQTKQSLLAGGKSGRAIVVGSSEKSLLVERIVSGSMPMGGEKLSDREIAQIRLWIDRVAPLEDDVRSTKLRVAAPEPVSEHDVLPILQMHCTVCHGKRSQEGGLDLRSPAGRLKGGRSGPALVPGKPESSLMMKRILAGEMPPPKMYVEYAVRPPNSTEVETLRRWIAAGAPTGVKEASGAKASNDPLVTDADREFWSFQPPSRPAIPHVRQAQLVRTPIDAFLLEKLEAKNLTFSPEAEQLTLMRRAYLDLIGLPPDPTEIEDYLKDKRVDAYEQMIDRLLASPHYGERWGQFWLNAAGYADSEGALDQDMVRPHAWRYRDYVIRSFNRDKPYDQFLLEQIAGDELIDYKHIKEATPEIVDQLAATGFLRMVPDGTYSPSNSSIPERFNVIADEIEVLGSAVLGLTLNCARCHNHKYDPIPQRDYYRLSAILQAAYDPYDWSIPVAVNRYNLRFPSRHLDIALESERREVAAFNAPLEAEIKRLEVSLESQSKPFREKLFAERVAGLPQPVKEDLQKVLATPEEKRTELQKYLAEKFQDTVKITNEDVVKRFADFKPEADRLQKAIDDLKKKLRLKPQIRALFDMGGEPSTAYLLRRGEAQTPGEQVQPGVPSVLKAGLSPYAVVPPPSNPQSSGRRLALARWLTQPRHPLTTRVIVNRIWMHHFGKGLVASPANFGRAGVPPSHPELLDWLATEFAQSGWSFKKMHRLIMTSTAFRQTSTLARDMHRSDPDNLLLSRMPLTRMDAEVLYDSILMATGQLDRKQFGPPDEVEINSEGEVIGKGTKAGWRRSIYVLQRRKTPMTMLDVFDLPAMSPNCIERRQSAVTTQALHLMNSDILKQHARYMAGRLIDEFGENQAGQINSLYLRAMSRFPTQREVEDARVSIVELTKHWKAHLEIEKHEAPKLQTAQWRALADYCHAILSSPEFLYID
jgi:uncharacterized protein DUF1553/uncharacterized protein DUF1549/cytochrome c